MENSDTAILSATVPREKDHNDECSPELVYASEPEEEEPQERFVQSQILVHTKPLVDDSLGSDQSEGPEWVGGKRL